MRCCARFSFVPYARLDDLMVSYAAPGGGVGPHVDSYDVFLLQGFGRRRWRYRPPARRRGCEPALPLEDPARFEPERRRWCSNRATCSTCRRDTRTTASPSTHARPIRSAFALRPLHELAEAFLDYLHDHLALEGRYGDPDAPPSREPARVPPRMLSAMARTVREVRWNARDVQRFIGMWLSEPKALVHFDRPRKALTAPRFREGATRRGVRLHRGTILLYDDRHWFVNGTAIERERAGG